MRKTAGLAALLLVVASFVQVQSDSVVSHLDICTDGLEAEIISDPGPPLLLSDKKAFQEVVVRLKPTILKGAIYDKRKAFQKGDKVSVRFYAEYTAFWGEYPRKDVPPEQRVCGMEHFAVIESVP